MAQKPREPHSLAIATSAYVLTRYAERSGPLLLPSARGDFENIQLGAVCGIAKWCHNAKLLLREPALRHVAEIFVLTNNVSFVLSECGADSLRAATYSKEVQEAVMAYGAAEERRQRRVAEHHGKRGRLSAGAVKAESQLLPPSGAITTLLKWQLIGETRYKSMLIVELDVDIFHHGRVTSRVPIPPVDQPTPRSTAEALRHAVDHHAVDLHTAPTLVAHSDGATPINAGTIFLTPSRDAFEAGLALLRTPRPFSPLTGWNHSGGPQQALSQRFVVAPACNTVVSCSWWSANTWNFIGGNADQGLLAAIFLRSSSRASAGRAGSAGARGAVVRAVRSGTRFGQKRKHIRWNCLLGACHFGGRDKPWLLHYTRCLRWFRFLDDNLTSESSVCVPWLRAQRRRAMQRARPAWDPCGGKVNECVL